MTLVAPLTYPTLGGYASPIGVQFGQVWTIQGPDGTTAVFNDPTSPNYVGTITDISGFDSPLIRENADDLVQLDGGIHGDFFYGRRSITLTGSIVNPVSVADRNAKLELLTRATRALRTIPTGTGPANATGCSRISWTPSGGTAVYLDARLQQPLRVSGGWTKEFQIQMVAADPRIYGSTLYDVDLVAPAASIATINYGNAVAYPMIYLTGPLYLPVIDFPGGSLGLYYNLTAGNTLAIDTLNRTVILNGTYSLYSAVDFANSFWGGIPPGAWTIGLHYTSYGSPANMQIKWRDTYI